MNTPTPPLPDDESLTPEERELADLYLQLPQAEPDAALDSTVLAAAAAPRGRRRAPRWVIGLGTAAALVLAAGIAWHLHAPGTATPRKPARMAPAAIPSPATRTMPPAAPRPAPAPHAAPPAAPPSPPPPPAEQRVRAQSSAPAIVPEAARLEAAPAPPPAPPPPVIESAAVAARTTATQAEKARAPLPPPVVYELAAPATPKGAPPSVAPPAPPPPVMETSSNAVAAPPPAPPSPPSPPAPTSQPPPPAPAPASAAAAPAALRHVRDLLRAGQRADAIKALRAFQRQHPGYVLPADLKALEDAGH